MPPGTTTTASEEKVIMRRRSACVLAVGFAAFLCGSSTAWAQASLGSAQTFAVLAGSTVTNTGATVVTGDVGVSPGAVIGGFPPGVILLGVQHAADGVALAAQNAVITQYNALASAPCLADLSGQDLGGLVLTSGTYCFSSSAQLTGTLTLNAQGNPAATFIFKIGSALTTASGSLVNLINGGNPCGVAWQVGSSATLGTSTSFIGNLIALTSITMTTGANIIGGRALARNGAVTLDTNTISFATCAAGGGPPSLPTLAMWAVIALIGLLSFAGFTTLRRQTTHQ
jgi:hypothetical protein